MTLQRAMTVDELWTGEMHGLELGGAKVVLVRLDDGVHAFEDRCAHLRFPLSAGKLEGNVITCAGHAWCYDARTGCGINPASARLRELPVVIEDGNIYVDVNVEGAP